MSERINVTKTYLPPIEEYEEYLTKIWDSTQLTNQGPLLREFEKKIEDYLRVDNFHLVTNGTLALQIAIESLGITDGEIITTPFSYVATTSAILWERCKPVYVDIEPDSFCIDADKIEAAITKDTKAILAVHVFGNACNVEKIDAIAKKHKIRVIYDAAHAFGVKYKNRSIFTYGDISVCSFHSTKLFHTIEGGGVFVNNLEFDNTVELMKRFGHNGDEHYMLGINAKASEFQAAMGLCNLKYIDENIAARRHVFELYNKLLSNKHIKLPVFGADTVYNYAYYPVVFKDETTLLKTIKLLNENNIFPRRYFYPSLNLLPYVKSNHDCFVSENIASRIMCLPLYAGLDDKKVAAITAICNSFYEA